MQDVSNSERSANCNQRHTLASQLAAASSLLLQLGNRLSAVQLAVSPLSDRAAALESESIMVIQDIAYITQSIECLGIYIGALSRNINENTTIDVASMVKGVSVGAIASHFLPQGGEQAPDRSQPHEGALELL